MTDNKDLVPQSIKEHAHLTFDEAWRAYVDGRVDCEGMLYHALKKAEAAPLRPQERERALRYEWLQDWYLREGKRAEIDPHGHIRQTTPEIMDAAIDRALREQEGRESDMRKPTLIGSRWPYFATVWRKS